MSLPKLDSATRSPHPLHSRPGQQQNQHAGQLRPRKEGCRDQVGEKGLNEEKILDSPVVEIWLLGSVSSINFQRLKQVAQWIHQSYNPQVSVQIQGELEETARTCIAERKAAIGGELLEHPNQDWLIYGLVPNDTLMYFSEVEHFVSWAASEFLFEDILLKQERPLDAIAHQAIFEKVSSLCQASTKVFCRVVFRISRPSHASTEGVNEANFGKKEALERESLVPRTDCTSVAPAVVEVFFEIDAAVVPRSSNIFIATARRKEYDGCIVHRVVPQGWIQFGDLIDGSGAHSGDWGPVPEEEKFAIRHDRAGILGMCKAQQGGSSQFYVTLSPYSQFDGFLVAIGKAVSGLQALLRVVQERVECDVNQRPLGDCFTVETVDIISA